MKRVNKNSSIQDICETLCELEAYEEFLDERLSKNYNPFERKRLQSDYYETKKKLIKVRKLLEA